MGLFGLIKAHQKKLVGTVVYKPGLKKFGLLLSTLVGP